VPTGQEGELVVTGLHNDLMPLIRYRIGDMGRQLGEQCSCGRGLPLFEITEGRMDDILTLPDGQRIGPRLLAPRIERIKGFTQYRLVQTQLDHLEIRLVTLSHDAEVPRRVQREVEKIVGPSVSVEVKTVDEIPLSRRGKLRKVVSEIRS